MDEDRRDAPCEGGSVDRERGEVGEPPERAAVGRVAPGPHVPGRPDLALRLPEPGRARGRRLIRHT